LYLYGLVSRDFHPAQPFNTASWARRLPESCHHPCFPSPEVWHRIHYLYIWSLLTRRYLPSLILANIMPPTCTNIRIRTARDAEIIFHAVRLGILPIVMQRLGSEERMALCTGCVYVWEERSGSLSESMEQGIERFTEGRSWGPSRYCCAFILFAATDTQLTTPDDFQGTRRELSHLRSMSLSRRN
jgi:hypothetical protein